MASRPDNSIMLKQCLLVCLLFIPPFLKGQLYPIHKYAAENGLAHSNVFRIMQDKKGFLWFATNYGVSCFNGKNFKNFNTENGLSGNVIMSVTELNDSSKLINTMSGIDLLINDSIRPFKAKYGNMPVRAIYAKQYDGKIWIIALNKGYDLYCVEKDSIRNIIIHDSNGQLARVTKMQNTASDGLVFISGKGLFTYRPGAGIRPFLDKLVTQEVTSFIQDKTGKYWVGLNDRLLCTDHEKIIASYRLNANAGVSDLLADSKNNIWACVPQQGIVLVQNSTAINITGKLGIKKILINNLFEDNEKNIWMATHGDGVYKISSLGMINYLPEADKLNVYARALLVAGNNTVLAGSYGTISSIRNNELRGFPVRSLISTDYIYFIRIINNEMYIGTPTGIIIKNMGTGKEKKIRTYGAISFLEVGKDSLWIGGFQHIGSLVNDKYALMKIPAVFDRRINCMLNEPGGTRWMGTDSGLFKLQNGGWSRELIPGAGKDPYINSMLFDREGRLWVAGEKGLFMRNKNTWRYFSEKEGLSHAKCNALAEDVNRNIWVGTKNGLNRIDSRTLRITEHPTGLYPNEVLSLLFDAGNNLVAGTVNGIAVIKELDNEITTRPPPLYITAVSTSEKNWLYPSDISLHAGDKKIVIDFIALSYSYPDNVEYRYKLENLYSQWNSTKNTSIELSSLTPGHYTFSIQARVNGGEWSNPAVLAISLPPVFWKTGWFFFLILITAITAFYYGIRWQLLRKEKKKNEALEMQGKMIHLRQQALGALISPHFIFNCLNSIQHYLNRNNKDLANRYLARFGRLIRLTLEYAQEMYIPIAVESDRLSLYLELEKLRCGDQLSYKIDIDSSLRNSNIRIPNMILQPYVENAVWHGIMPKEKRGSLLVQVVRQNAGEILIRIEDDGVGMAGKKNPAADSSKKHISFGMNLISERLELFKKTNNRNYEVKVTDRSAIDPSTSGTIVELNLPVLHDPDAAPLQN